jgi:predicted ArsR family transcriptional regulator
MCKITESALEPPSTTSYVAQITTAREIVRETIRESGTIRLDELTEQLQLDERHVHRELADLEREKRIDRFVVGTKIMLRSSEADT